MLKHNVHATDYFSGTCLWNSSLYWDKMLPVYLYVFAYLCKYVCLFHILIKMSKKLCMPVSLSLSLSVSVCLSVCLSLSLSVSLYFYICSAHCWNEGPFSNSPARFRILTWAAHSGMVLGHSRMARPMHVICSHNGCHRRAQAMCL